MRDMSIRHAGVTTVRNVHPCAVDTRLANDEDVDYVDVDLSLWKTDWLDAYAKAIKAPLLAQCKILLSDTSCNVCRTAKVAVLAPHYLMGAKLMGKEKDTLIGRIKSKVLADLNGSETSAVKRCLENEVLVFSSVEEWAGLEAPVVIVTGFQFPQSPTWGKKAKKKGGNRKKSGEEEDIVALKTDPMLYVAYTRATFKPIIIEPGVKAFTDHWKIQMDPDSEGRDILSSHGGLPRVRYSEGRLIPVDRTLQLKPLAPGYTFDPKDIEGTCLSSSVGVERLRMALQHIARHPELLDTYAPNVCRSIQLLGDRHSDVRLQALKTIASTTTTELTQARKVLTDTVVQSLINDNDFNVRREAVKTIASMSAEMQKFTAGAVAHCLDDPNLNVRLEALNAIVSMQPEVQDRLAAVVIHCEVLTDMISMPLEERKAHADTVAKCLRGRITHLRRHALNSVTLMPAEVQKDIAGALVSCLGSSDSSLRREVLDKILSTPLKLQKVYAGALARFMGESDWRVRGKALNAIVLMPTEVQKLHAGTLATCICDTKILEYIRRNFTAIDSVAVDVIAICLGNNDANVRLQALKLIAFRPVHARTAHVGAIAKCLSDIDKRVQGEAETVFSLLPVPTMVKCLSDSDAYVRRKALQQIASSKGVIDRNALLTEQEKRGRWLILLFLGRKLRIYETRLVWARLCSFDGHALAVAKCLNDTNLSVRMEALKMLASMSEGLQKAHAYAVVSRLGDSDWRVRHEAVRTFFSMPLEIQKAYAGATAECLDDSNYKVRMCILHELGSLKVSEDLSEQHSFILTSHTAGVVKCLVHINPTVRELAMDAFNLLPMEVKKVHVGAIVKCLMQSYGHMREKALEAAKKLPSEGVLECLEDIDWRVRRQALKIVALQRLSWAYPVAVVQRMVDDKEKVRREAARTFSRLPVHLVVACLCDSDDRVRWETLTAIKSTYHIRTSLVTAVLKCMGDTGSRVHYHGRYLSHQYVPRYNDAVVKCLDDENVDVRQQALKVLMSMPAEVQKAHVRTVVKCLGDKQLLVRQQALKAIAAMPAEIQKAHASAVVNCLQDGDEEFRCEALKAIASMPAEVQKAHASAVVKCLGDKHLPLRQQALKIISSMPGEVQKVHVSSVVQCLGDVDKDLRWEALKAIVSMPAEAQKFHASSVVKFLAIALLVRQQAMYAADVQDPSSDDLEKLKEKEDEYNKMRRNVMDIIDAMPADAQKVHAFAAVQCLGDEDENIRKEALEFIASMPTNVQTVYASAVAKCFGDEDVDVRCRALKLIASMPAEVQKVHASSFVKSLGDEDKDVRWEALEAIGSMPAEVKKVHVSAVVKCLGDEQWNVRRQALKAIGVMPAEVQKVHVSAVVKCLGDEDADVRYEALKVIASMPPEVQKIQVSAVVECLGDEDEDVRYFAQASIASMPASAVLFVNCLGHEYEDVRFVALQGIASMPAEVQIVHINAVVKCLGDEDADVRYKALEVIASMPADVQKVHANPVVQCLGDEDKDVRCITLDVMASMPAEVQKVHASAVVKCLGDEDKDVRHRALCAITTMPAEVHKAHAGAVIHCLGDEHEDVRWQALSAFWVMPSDVQKSYAGEIETSMVDDDEEMLHAISQCVGYEWFSS